MLFRAAAQLRDDGRDVTVCVVGDGPRRAALARDGGGPRARRLDRLGRRTGRCEEAAGRLRRRRDLLRLRRAARRSIGNPCCRRSDGLYRRRYAARHPFGRSRPHRPCARSCGVGDRDPPICRRPVRRGSRRESVRGTSFDEHYEFEQMVRAFERVYDRVLGRDARD